MLSGAWLMAALWLYLKQANAARGPRRIMLLAASLSCYVLSLLSKAAGVPLPAVLIAIDLYPLRRISIGDRRELLRALAEKALFAVPAGVFALTAIWAQSDAGAMRSMAEHGLGDRVAQGFFGLAFYLGKTVWPSGLLPLYEWPDDASPMDARVLISVAVILVLAGAAWVWRRRRPAVATALFCYVALVSPVLGVAQSGPQVAADRYTYLPMMPWAVAAGGGMAWFLATASAAGRRRAGLGVVAVTVVFVVLTRAQVSVWATPESLWTHMVEHNPQHPKGWSGLAGALRRRAAVSGDAALIRQAAEYYDRAMALRPDMLSPHVGAGHCAADLGDFDAAVRHYHDALALKPTDEDALRGLAHVLGVAGRFNEADEAYARVFEVLPDAIDAHYAYANLLNRQQRYAEAATQFEIVISRGGPDARAMAADACYGLSLALEQSGDEAAAIAALRRGLALDERHVLLTARLAWMLAAPTDPQWLDPAEALRLAQRAVALCEGTSVVADEALAAAQAAGGDFDAAVATLDARLQTAGQEEPGWVARLRAQRDAYRNGRTGPP